MNIPITKYEKARLIGVRADQLSKGAKPLTDYTGIVDTLKIAEKEYREGVIPISIIRVLPSGEKIQVDLIPSRGYTEMIQKEPNPEPKPKKKLLKRKINLE